MWEQNTNPWPGIELATSQCPGQCPTHWVTPARAVSFSFLRTFCVKDKKGICISIYCCITNYCKTSSLKQEAFTISHSFWESSIPEWLTSGSERLSRHWLLAGAAIISRLGCGQRIYLMRLPAALSVPPRLLAGNFSSSPDRPLHGTAHRMAACLPQSERSAVGVGDVEHLDRRHSFLTCLGGDLPSFLLYAFGHTDQGWFSWRELPKGTKTRRQSLGASWLTTTASEHFLPLQPASLLKISGNRGTQFHI